MNADKRRYLNLENYNQIQLLGNSEQLPPTVKITIPSSTITKDWGLICEHLRISADNKKDKVMSKKSSKIRLSAAAQRNF